LVGGLGKAIKILGVKPNPLLREILESFQASGS